MPRLKVPRPRTNTITPEQLEQLLTNASPWMRCFLVLGITLGLRHSEILDVRPAGYDPAGHSVRFKAKGGEVQTMPTIEPVEELFTHAPAGDPLTPLVELYRGAPVSKNSVWWEWKKLKRQSGIREPIIPHDLRRTFAVSTHELTRDIGVVWQLLRHKDLSTTARYLEHRDPTHLREILAQMWRPKGAVQ